MTKLKMRIGAMLESNGNVTFFGGLTKPGFKSEFHTGELKYQVCGTTNYDCMIDSVMRAGQFFGLPRADVISEILALYLVSFVDKKKLDAAIMWWSDLESWKPQYQEWK